MPVVGAEVELQTLTECRYRFPAETLRDVDSVRARFRDLRLCVDFYCFPNDEKRRLLHLSGTLPVLYQGSQYNIPVCVWLHQTHPLSRPRCSVCPSVSMAINPSCPYVDPSGTVHLDGLQNWTPGVSSLSLLLSEMRRAFQKDTPLYSMCVAQTPPPAEIRACGRSQEGSARKTWDDEDEEERVDQRVRTSYTEELKGIDFSSPPSSSTNPFLSSASSSGVPLSEPLSVTMGSLRLDGGRRSQPAQHGSGAQSPQPGPATGAHLWKVSQVSGPQLSPDQAAIFLSLMSISGRSFSTDDAIEAVQHSPDFPSALKFLTYTCPICHEQVSFSKMVTMTHCSCFLCQSCFTSCFSVAIRERGVHQLGCPQCGCPEISAQGTLEDAMDYFNLLDTQIRHFLPPDLHELFQRKLRDRALQDMPSFCWCAHCSFGMLHESDRLQMDCPSCQKSTCSRCRSPWSPHHQGLTCQEFKARQQQNQPDRLQSTLSPTIECPRCGSVFSLSRGGCLHFTCSQCLHQFCGGCRRRFALGAACGFSARCGSRGLHAHHPRDCLYHLRDWSVGRLLRLLQRYGVSPSWVDPPDGGRTPPPPTAACSMLELRDSGGVTKEEACGRAAASEHRGYCQAHYKERLVELINRRRVDPAVLFTPAETIAELQRWNVAVPTRTPEELEPLYAHRLRLVLTNSLPLRDLQPQSASQPN